MPARKVGFLHNGTKASFQKHFAVFVIRLYDFIEQDDVEIRERWAGDDTSMTLDQHAIALANEGVDVLVAAGGPPSARAAIPAASKTPVVFMSVAKPIELKLTTSLDVPDMNMTGIAGLTSELDLARLLLLHEALDFKPVNIGVLSNTTRFNAAAQLAALEAEANKRQINLIPVKVDNKTQIESRMAVARSGSTKLDGLLVTADSMFNDFRGPLVRFALDIPAIYQWREFAEAGGLMSFGPNIFDAYAKVGEFTGHILDGAKPSELRIELPERFELVINLRAANDMDRLIPPSLLSRAEIVKSRMRARRLPLSAP